LLLQNAAFLPYFRDSMQSRGKVGTAQIEELGAGEASVKLQSVDSIFKTISKDRPAASREMLEFLDSGGEPQALVNAARRLVFAKGNDAHDYKFSSAVLEDYYAVSPEFRNRYLATAAQLLPGSGDRDNGLVQRIQQAFS